ncbi:MAG TPA: division/cell wall cluster transcriptional repressor MraZ [Thermoanaerobaculia bacterium]|nr:division/cell wall cluster transcriptional repressor MraZ [Thermoanaerobaculia bacterium]
MFRGSAATKIDEKGRLKVPTEFRRLLAERYGPDVFLTSVLGDSVLLYPLSVWEEIESRLAAMPSTDRVKQRFLERVSYYGQQGKIDGQGRVLVPPILRDSAEMAGEVVVSGRIDYLEVWNRTRLEKRFSDEPFTDDDFRYLSEHKI